MSHFLVTGAAGFIGSHLVEKLLATDHQVTCIDNFDPFYEISIKKNNVRAINNHPRCQFIEADIRDKDAWSSAINKSVDCIIHLAAKAGVRPSLENPSLYHDVNVNGTINLLEFAKQKGIKNFIFASSSSVYGINRNIPWSEDEKLFPISPYAATKVSGESLGHVYSQLYGIRFTGLRFFTVFGPRQRPDLAIHKFFNLIYNGFPVKLFGNGDTFRDYTYIDDIIDGIMSSINYSKTGYEVFNLGNNHTVSLFDLIEQIQEVIGVQANIVYENEQLGDVRRTFADLTKPNALLEYRPQTTLKQGLYKFHEWYKEIHGIRDTVVRF